MAEHTEPTPDEVEAHRIVSEFVGIGSLAVPPRVLAEQMLAEAGGLLVATSGRDEAVRVLRGIVEHLEKPPETSGTA